MVNISVNVDFYFWLFGDGSIFSVIVFVYIYVEDGGYIVIFIIENVCGADILE